MAGWHYQLNGHEFEQALGESEGQGSLTCCSPWSRKDLDMTKPRNSEQYWKGLTNDTTCREDHQDRGMPHGLEKRFKGGPELGQNEYK